MRSIAVSIMLSTTVDTRPYSYPQCAQSTRPGPCETGRASHTGAGFVDFAVGHAKPVGFVLQACAKLAPAGIMYRLGHTSFGQFGTRDVSHDDQTCSIDYRCRGLVRPVFARIFDAGMDGLDALLFVGTLGHP